MAGLVSVLSPEDHAALSAWCLGPILSATIPTTGTVNRTVIVQTAGGAYVLRAYRRPDAARAEWEHRAIVWASAHGIPVCPPFPLPGGGTVACLDGRLFALFPLASGWQVARADLQEAEVAAAGRCLARIHLAFAGFPVASARHKLFTFDTAATLEGLARVQAAVAARTVQTASDRTAQHHLADRREWLQERAILDAPMRRRFDTLPLQVIHGDFQETNLFFDGGEVSAVIDWDQCGVAPRAWEVLRALHLMLDLAPDACRVFLAAYRSLYPLPDRELQEAAEGYGVLADQNLWVYQALYLEGDDRVRPFLTPGAFVPFAARWHEMTESKTI